MKDEKKAFQMIVDMMAEQLVNGFEDNLKTMTEATELVEKNGDLPDLSVADIASKIKESAQEISLNMLGMYFCVMQLKEKTDLEDFSPEKIASYLKS